MKQGWLKNQASAKEFLTDRVNARLVPSGDGQALAEAVAELAADPAAREALGAAGRELFECLFDAHQIGTDLLEALETHPNQG